MKTTIKTFTAIIIILLIIFTLIWIWKPIEPLKQPTEDTTLFNHSEIPKDTD